MFWFFFALKIVFPAADLGEEGLGIKVVGKFPYHRRALHVGSA